MWGKRLNCSVGWHCSGRVCQDGHNSPQGRRPERNHADELLGEGDSARRHCWCDPHVDLIREFVRSAPRFGPLTAASGASSGSLCRFFKGLPDGSGPFVRLNVGGRSHEVLDQTVERQLRAREVSGHLPAVVMGESRTSSVSCDVRAVTERHEEGPQLAQASVHLVATLQNHHRELGQSVDAQGSSANCQLDASEDSSERRRSQ